MHKFPFPGLDEVRRLLLLPRNRPSHHGYTQLRNFRFDHVTTFYT